MTHVAVFEAPGCLLADAQAVQVEPFKPRLCEEARVPRTFHCTEGGSPTYRGASMILSL